MGLQQTLRQEPVSAGRMPRRLTLAMVCFLMSWGVIQSAQATALDLVFEEAWHESARSNPPDAALAQAAEPSPSVVTPPWPANTGLNAGLVRRVTQGGISSSQAVSDHILGAQVSSA